MHWNTLETDPDVPRGSTAGRLQTDDSFLSGFLHGLDNSQFTVCLFRLIDRVYTRFPASGEGQRRPTTTKHLRLEQPKTAKPETFSGGTITSKVTMSATTSWRSKRGNQRHGCEPESERPAACSGNTLVQVSGSSFDDCNDRRPITT